MLDKLRERAAELLLAGCSPGPTYPAGSSGASRTAARCDEITDAYRRLRTLAPTSPDEVVRGLDDLHAVYHEDAAAEGNWWHWEIGAPMALLETCTLVYNRLDRRRLASYLRAATRFCPDPNRRTGWPDLPETGANRADKAAITALAGVLGSDPERIALARDALSPLFAYVTSGDGFYSDGSFIQHENLPYAGSYGIALLSSLGWTCALLAGSPWEVTDPGLRQVIDAVERGFAPFVHKGLVMAPVRGRAISRETTTDADAGRDLAKAASLLTGSALGDPQGCHLFPEQDRVVHRRPGWSFALSLSSRRIARYESINDENLRAWHTADGMTYLYNDDLDHYVDGFWPTVDPCLLPGTTVSAAPHDHPGPGPAANDWAGGAVLDGVGAAGLELAGPGPTGRKSWFMLDGAVIALGAGISGEGRVVTVVENRKTDAAFQQGDGWAHLETVGGYAFPLGDLPAVERHERSGSWREINAGDELNRGSTTVLTRPYTTLLIEHGDDPVDAAYAYALLPGTTPVQAAGWAGVEILANTPGVQAIRAGRVFAATFWEPGEVAGIGVDTPCAVIVRDGVVAVADPSRTAEQVTLAGDITVNLAGSRGRCILRCDR